MNAASSVLPYVLFSDVQSLINYKQMCKINSNS